MPKASTSDTGLGDVRNLLGFVVAGFAGVLNVIGLKSAEIGVVLRNEPIRVSVVATFLLAGALAAVASVFIRSNAHPIPFMAALIVFLVMTSAFSLTIWIIPSPFGDNSGNGSVSALVTLGLWACSLTLIVCAVTWILSRRKISGFRRNRVLRSGRSQRSIVRRSRRTRPLHRRFPELLNLQCVLLLSAIMLTSTSAYGALRLETISQTSTVAEIGETLQFNGAEATLSIAVSAAKLSSHEWLTINAIAVPRSWHLQKMCGSRKVRALKIKKKVTVSCTQDPCYYFSSGLHKQCIELSQDIIAPDSSGGVQRTIDIPFTSRSYQHVQVTAVTCQPRTGKKKPKGSCGPTGATSRLDISIP